VRLSRRVPYGEQRMGCAVRCCRLFVLPVRWRVLVGTRWRTNDRLSEALIMQRFASVLLSVIALSTVVLSGSAQAGGNSTSSIDRPGSLLVFPYFSNAGASNTFITVTNTNPDSLGTVDVEFVYINGQDCLEFNRTRRLTPNDTITVASKLDNPDDERGYVYVFAKSPLTGAAISWNWLEGDSIIASAGDLLLTNVSPVVYAAMAPQGVPTDLDADGIRDMNGMEYASNPDELHIPRFIATAGSSLIFLGFTGASFTTVVNYVAYNDNEEAFSGQVTFDCWDIRRLNAISGIFTDSFLESTNHDIGETGVLGKETGWMRLNSVMAYSSAAQQVNPAFLAVRVDSSLYATLPYGLGENRNGDLLVLGPFPDTN
jgi:hypothetical protein